MSPEEIREHATTLILDNARDIDSLDIGESLEDVLDGTALDDYEAVCRQIDELIRTATITVDWPQAEAGAPVTAHSVTASEVEQLRAELEQTRDQRDAAQLMADELRADLRAADENNGNLQQHIADIRNGAF